MTKVSDLKTVDLSPRIGTAIQADKQALLSGRFSEEIRELLELRGVVCFPEVGFDDGEQVAFTKTLGSLPDSEKASEGGIFKVTLDSSKNSVAEYLKGAFYWHIDGTMSQVPIRASLLSARQLAPEGGETEFCNTYAAYDDLPDGEKAQIDGLQVVHSFEVSQRYVNPEPSYELLREWQNFGGENTLPLVWKHQSGRKSLILGSTAAYVVGMSPAESTALLVKLRDWATKPQFVYRHVWSLGDLIIWDNTGTMHRALPYALDSGRMMHRTSLQGEEAFA